VALEHDMAQRTKSVKLSGSNASTQPRETGEYTVGSSPAPAPVWEAEKIRQPMARRTYVWLSATP